MALSPKILNIIGDIISGKLYNPWILDHDPTEIHLISDTAWYIIQRPERIRSVIKFENPEFFNKPYEIYLYDKEFLLFKGSGKLYIDGIVFKNLRRSGLTPNMLLPKFLEYFYFPATVDYILTMPFIPLLPDKRFHDLSNTSRYYNI